MKHSAIDMPPTTRGGTYRVLVVDDSAAQRRLLSAVLERMGFEVVAVADPQQALFLCLTDEGASIRMIVSDWQMPVMDGPDFCTAFRQLTRNDYTYFILMTSETDRRIKARGLESGADDFVTRPVDLAELRARVSTGRRILEMQEVLLHRNHEARLAYENLRTLQEATNRDLVEARSLQRAFLPPVHHAVGGSALSLRLITSGHIGGDLVGYFPISDTRLALYSIDVSGHGIASALLTGRLAGLFPWRSRRGNIAFRRNGSDVHPPEVVMGRLNYFMLQEMASDIYFTAVLAYVDLETGDVEFCQAGHPHPLIRRLCGRVERAGEGGPPVGLIAGAEFERVRVRLGPGDSFLAYSDGLTECADTWGDMLEEEGLMALLAAAPPDTERAVSGIEEALRDHCGINDFADDISMLLFRFGRARPA